MLEALRSLPWAELVDWREVLADAVRIAVVVVLAFLTYRVVRIATGRLQREIDDEDPFDKRRREQRLRTVASLLNSIGAAVIAGLALLMILSTFIEIGPLLATAGVAGLAISFGAQSLVKDILTGIFLMAEEQFGIGDVVSVKDKGVTGLVERISLRTTVLRDVEGTVHVIPNGEITMVSNLTKGWSKAVLDIGVAYKEDVDRVLGVLREECDTLWQDEEWSQIILEEPEVPGVQALADSSVVLRVMFKTLPLKQWNVAREYRRRIKRRFDDDGIEIPFPHRTIYLGDGAEFQVPPRDADTSEPATA